ncbi:MAG: glycosyltransferase family 2 protein [Fimbriimonadales bacterium]|nr:glycosyltransferase family 2 protein [Fimbriimonadales bacterium]
MQQVTICIPTRNQAGFLPEAIRSAASQGPGWPVLVSDDASEDETPEALEQLSREMPTLRFWRQETPLGIAGNRNFLLRQVETPFCVMLDSDDALEPDYCSTLLPWMEDPMVAYAHADCMEIDAAGHPKRIRMLHRAAGIQTPEEALRAGVSGYRAAANILLFRVEALLRVGGYDTRLRYPEDWDLSLRLADAGWANAYVPRVLARYRVWSGPLRPRLRRKLDEIEGVAHIYRQTLTTAFEKRGWDTTPIRRAARARAMGFSIDLDLFQGEEREAVRQALLSLHDDPTFRWVLWLQVRGAGGLRRGAAATKGRCVDAAKGFLRKRRRGHG